VQVRELVARDPATAAALWSRLTDLDLTSRIHTDPRALDDPLLHQLVNVPAAAPRLTDRLWVRLVDLPAALAARRYQAPVDVVLEVTDALLPANAGRWRLTAGPDQARCERTDAEPDLALDVRELGAAYLGGTGLAGLASAGLLHELRPGTLTPAAVAFGWPVPPHSGWTF
jgi:predicted acetyltransferase